MVIAWLDFGEVLLETFVWANFLLKIWMCFFMVLGYIAGMVGPIDVKRKGNELVGYWVQYVTLTFDLTHQVKSSQVKDILLHNITSVHTLNTETEAHWGLFASVILAFVTISWPHWETKTRVSKGAICQCAIPCCDGRHHIITITWNGIISAIKLWYSTILASYLFVHEICSHILFEKINGGGILNV